MEHRVVLSFKFHIYVRGSSKVATVAEKLCVKRLSWYEHVMRKNEGQLVRKVLSEGGCQRKGLKKRCMDCLKDEIDYN